MQEVKDVFNVYGIGVNPRHLLLIADYMTYTGQFEPLSRTGLESSASPLQQMSFEASLKFLTDAAVRGKYTNDTDMFASGSLVTCFRQTRSTRKSLQLSDGWKAMQDGYRIFYVTEQN